MTSVRASIIQIAEKAASIERQLAQEKDRFSIYTETFCKNMSEAVQKSRDVEDKGLYQIKDIKQKIKSLEMQKLKLQNTLEVESKEESILQSEVDKLRSSLITMQEKVRIQREASEKQRYENQKVRSELQSNESSRRQNLVDVNKLVSMYKDRLGLEFVRVGPHRMRFIFTYIDPEKDDRQYEFQIFIDGENKVHLEGSRPMLSSSFTSPLLQKMNSNPDDSTALSMFVVSVRKEFKRMAIAGGNL